MTLYICKQWTGWSKQTRKKKRKKKENGSGRENRRIRTLTESNYSESGRISAPSLSLTWVNRWWVFFLLRLFYFFLFFIRFCGGSWSLVIIFRPDWQPTRPQQWTRLLSLFFFFCLSVPPPSLSFRQVIIHWPPRRKSFSLFPPFFFCFKWRRIEGSIFLQAKLNGSFIKKLIARFLLVQSNEWTYCSIALKVFCLKSFEFDSIRLIFWPITPFKLST